MKFMNIRNKRKVSVSFLVCFTFHECVNEGKLNLQRRKSELTSSLFSHVTQPQNTKSDIIKSQDKFLVFHEPIFNTVYLFRI